MPFVYMESSPHLKGKARDYGRSYRRMAVVEVSPDHQGYPSMISARAKGVVRIVDETTAFVGKTDRSFGYRERARLRVLAVELNRLEQERGP